MAVQINQSLALALEGYSRSRSVDEADFTRRIQNASGGIVPMTLKAYINTAQKIIRDLLLAKRNSNDVLSFTVTTSSRPQRHRSHRESVCFTRVVFKDEYSRDGHKHRR